MLLGIVLFVAWLVGWQISWGKKEYAGLCGLLAAIILFGIGMIASITLSEGFSAVAKGDCPIMPYHGVVMTIVYEDDRESYYLFSVAAGDMKCESASTILVYDATGNGWFNYEHYYDQPWFWLVALPTQSGNNRKVLHLPKDHRGIASEHWSHEIDGMFKSNE